MTAKLKKRDVEMLLGLVAAEIGRLGQIKERYGCRDPSHFYRLIDIRNRLLALLEELPPHLSDEELEKLFGGKGIK